MAAKAKEVVVPQTAAVTVSDEEMEFLQQHKGEGISTAAEDNLVPLIQVMQVGSKQVNRTGPAYVEGATAGSFLMRAAPHPIVDGAEGFVFQPCYFYKDFAEWIPRERGGGLVGMHHSLPQGVEEVRDERNPNKVKWRTPTGNDIIERRNHLGFVVHDDGSAYAYAIPFTSTGHAISKNWMTVMQNRSYNGVVPPSYSFLYHLRTRQRSNAQGTWFIIDIEPVQESPLLAPSGMVNKALRDKGMAFHEACKRGDKRAEEMEDADREEAAPTTAF